MTDERRIIGRWLAPLVLALALVACDAGSGGADTDIRDTIAADTAIAVDTTSQDATGALPCGRGPACSPTQACRSQGPGGCFGDPPGPNGCGAFCQSVDCGGGTTCLCQSFNCRALPSGCATCSCLEASLQGAEAYLCSCVERSDGSLALECAAQ